jgi:hypothetical protein
MEKTFVVLANSIRRSQWCVAARELIERDGEWTSGPWIRPVSEHGEGELYPQEIAYRDGGQPQVLDVVRATPAGTQACAHQPENYLLEPGCPWERMGTFPCDRLGLLEENPATLWLEPGNRTDRIHCDLAVASVSPFQSLYLIRLTELSLHGWQEHDPFRGRPRKQRRAVFKYGGSRYSLSITDPTIDSRCFTPFPQMDQPRREVAPEHADRCLLVVSLAPAFTDGYHYKVVATVLEY